MLRSRQKGALLCLHTVTEGLRCLEISWKEHKTNTAMCPYTSVLVAVTLSRSMSSRRDGRNAIPAARVNAGRSGNTWTSAYEDAIIAAVEEELPGNSRDIARNLGLS